MKARIIKTKAECEAALARIEKLMDAAPNTAQVSPTGMAGPEATTAMPTTRTTTPEAFALAALMGL